MKFAFRHVLISCLVLSAFLGGVGLGYSQGLVVPQPVPPVVLSGADIGFRMSARKGDVPVGQLVVRINGEWKEVEFGYGVKRLTK